MIHSPAASSADEGSSVGLARFLLRYYGRYTRWIVVAVVTIPLYGAASAALVALIDPVFTDVLQVGRPAITKSADGLRPDHASRAIGLKAVADHAYTRLRRAAGVDDRTVVIFTPLLVLAVFIVRASADAFGEYAFQRVGLGITADLRNDLATRLIEQDARFHVTHPTGELISRVTSDVTLMQSGLSSRLFDIGQQSVTLVLLLGLLLSTDAALASALLLVAPVFLLVIARFGRAVRRASRETQARMGEVSRVLLEGLVGHAVVASFNGEQHEQARFRTASSRHLSAMLRGQVLSTLSSSVIESLAIATTAGFLIYAGLRVRSGALTVPLLVQFLANVWLLYDPLRRLNKANMALQPLAAAGERIRTMIETPNTVLERPGARPLTAFTDRIVFDGVTVRYGERIVVDRVSFEVRRGETVAIVGASGAGKTTLSCLLPRFFDPDEGRVTIDGADVRDLTLASLRGLIGLVTQSTVLFDDTIRNNIAYARPAPSWGAVERAADAACASVFIAAMADGFETVVGENGCRLSGGERQRLAVARALLKDAPILILDEATSQLDSAAEAVVHRALANLMQGRTVLIIAHHLHTIRQASRIVVLDQGTMVDSGTHDELLGRCDVYRVLFRHWSDTRHE
jgi:ATP-binding cassette, subfamily B, bacterial MsbA